MKPVLPSRLHHRFALNLPGETMVKAGGKTLLSSRSRAWQSNSHPQILRKSQKKAKRVAGKEARFRKHVNHVISKSIVESAERTGRGIALEDLTGIRQRVTARGGEARNRLSGWSFAELGSFVAYKAKLAGVPVVHVDPRNTSRMCAECGHVEKANRKSQARFSCKACGHEANADRNAARNIRAQAVRKSALELASLTA
jgi:IS605 OrfB family transposase